MRAFFIELEDPNSEPGWTTPAIEPPRPRHEIGGGIHDPISRQAREEVMANVDKVKLQVEQFNAAVAGRLAWMRAHGNMTEVPEYAAVDANIPETEDVPEPAPKRFRGSEDIDLPVPDNDLPGLVPFPADD